MKTLKELDAFYPTEADIQAVLTQNFPLAHHKGFFWNFNQEGYRDYTFGCRSGPVRCLSALAHELGHAIEFGAKSFEFRAKDCHGRFRFQEPRQWAYDRYVCEPQSGVMSEREARALGIEARLMELFTGHTLDMEDFKAYCFRLREFLPDWHFYSQREEAYKQLVQDTYEAFETSRCLSELNRWFEKTHLTLRLKVIRRTQSADLATA